MTSLGLGTLSLSSLVFLFVMGPSAGLGVDSRGFHQNATFANGDLLVKITKINSTIFSHYRRVITGSVEFRNRARRNRSADDDNDGGRC